MGARHLVTPEPTIKPRKRWTKRGGKMTEAETNLVTQWALDQPHEVTEQQTKALARAMGRNPNAIRSAVEEARDKFRERVGDYADLHFQAVQGAMETADPKGFDAAIKGAQWALERVADDKGVRVVEPVKQAGVATDSGPKILVGIQVGGVNQPPQLIDLPTVKQISADTADITVSPDTPVGGPPQ